MRLRCGSVGPDCEIALGTWTYAPLDVLAGTSVG